MPGRSSLDHDILERLRALEEVVQRLDANLEIMRKTVQSLQTSFAELAAKLAEKAQSPSD